MTATHTTNVVREHGFGKCYAWCTCGWVGRERNLTDENRVKALADASDHKKREGRGSDG